LDSALASGFLTYGPLGLFCLLLLLGWIVPKPFMTKLESENEFLKRALETERTLRAEAARAALTTNQLLDALTAVAAQRQASGIPREGTAAREGA